DHLQRHPFHYDHDRWLRELPQVPGRGHRAQFEEDQGICGPLSDAGDSALTSHRLRQGVQDRALRDGQRPNAESVRVETRLCDEGRLRPSGRPSKDGEAVCCGRQLTVANPKARERHRRTIPMTTTAKHGLEVLQDPSLNKSTAFTEAEKQALGIVGLVPDVTETEDLQLSRVMMQLGHKTTDLDRYIYLVNLLDHNEVLFYRTVMSDPARFLPIVYDPTIGEACLKFGHIYRQARGMYLSMSRPLPSVWIIPRQLHLQSSVQQPHTVSPSSLDRRPGRIRLL